MHRTLYSAIASALSAREYCRKYGNTEWFDRYAEAAHELTHEHMPSGSGIDTGVTLEIDASTPEKLVFTFGVHHMDESGMYDGWTDHTLIVTPSLAHGIALRITGRDRNGIKEYLSEVFDSALRQIVDSHTVGAK